MTRRTRALPRAGLALALLGLATCASGGPPPVPGGPHAEAAHVLSDGPEEGPRSHLVVDADRREVVLVAGPFRVRGRDAGDEGHARHGTTLPQAGHDHEDRSPLIPLEWPVEGWLRGFQVALLDSRGRPLPRSLLHHLIAVNLDRRQVVYPVAERLFGVGRETADVVLPRGFGVPLAEGTRIGVYASWHNETDEDLDGVYLQVRFPFQPQDGGRAPREVLPVYMDVNNVIGGTTAYDLPPGWSERSYEFRLPVGGRLLAVGGHLHEHGVAVRLEDGETGEVLVEVGAILDEEGGLVGVEQKILRRLFGLLDASVPLEEGRLYRVVGIYDSPLPHPLPSGAMAHMVGIFEPEEWSGWTELDRATPVHRADMAGLPEPLVPLRTGDPWTGEGAGVPPRGR